MAMTEHTLEISRKDYTDKEWSVILWNFWCTRRANNRKELIWLKENNVKVISVENKKLTFSAPSEETLIMLRLKWL